MAKEHAGPVGRVRGAGGGGGGGGEAPDTLRSTQWVETVDLLGEGELGGLTNGLKSVYFDGVPLQNADDSFNFEGVTVEFTPGTQGQASITGADGVQTEVAVAVDVLHATPVVRTITNPAADQVRVTIAVNSLSTTSTDNGDVTGAAFEWAVEIQSDGGGYVQVLQEVVSGKTGSRATFSKVLPLAGSAPWDVRVKRLSADSGSAYVVNAFSWSSYTEIQQLKLRHPNSALVRTRLPASQFSRVPVRSFDVMGARVQIPTNYNPKTKTYSGLWDGTFKIGWTDCPPWLMWAALTNPRYGLGRFFNVGQALKWSMYRYGQYCDEMVSDGAGGLEPRFKAGFVLATREQAFKVLSDMAAVFRGMSYWLNDGVAVTQDAPAAVTTTPYTPANIVGKFRYSSGSHSRRHSQATVWFNDLQQHGKLVPEVVRDRAMERRIGIKPMELSPLGCWSRGQAHRLGLWALLSEQHDGETVSFRVGLDGVLTPPGEVFPVADPHEAGERLGGRVRSATTSAVTLDAPVTLAPGEAYTLSVMLPHATNGARLVSQVRAVVSASGLTSVINVSPPFAAAPAAQTMWMLASEAVQPTLWRCLSVREVAGSNEFEMVGLRHYPGKYAAVDEGVAFELPPVSRMALKPAKPTDLSLTEAVYTAGTVARSRATLSWREGAPGLRYGVSWRLANGPWTDMPPTSANCVEVDGLQPGLLQMQVRSLNTLGTPSPAVPVELELLGEAGASVGLVASAQSFAFTAAGAAKPAGQVITLSARRVNLAGLAAITATGYDADGSNPVALTLGGAGELRTLAIAALGSKAYARAVATLGSRTAEVVISRVVDGAAGQAAVTGYLTNESVTLAADKDGVVVTFAPSAGAFKVFNGLTDVTASATFGVFSEGGIHVVMASDGTYSVTEMGADAGQATLRAVYGSVTLDKVLAVGKSKAGQTGAAGANASVLTLLPTAQAFTYNGAGAATPSSQTISLTAQLANLSGTATFTCTLYDSAGSSLGTVTLGGSGNTRTLSLAQFDVAHHAVIEATLSGKSDQVTVVRLRDGATGATGSAGQAALSGYLTNESVTLAADKDGVVGDLAPSAGAFKVFNGLTDVTASATFGVTGGENLVITLNSDGTYVATNVYADTSWVSIRATYGSTVVDKRLTVSKSRAGQTGAAGSNASVLTLLASALTFTYDTAGSANPAGQTITATAQLANLSGTATFTCTLYDASGSSLGTVDMGGSGNTRTLTDTQFGAARFAVIEASRSGYSDKVTVVRLRDGAAGQAALTGFLTNEAHSVATAADGSGGSYGAAGGQFKVFNGATLVTSGLTFSVVSGSVSGISGMSIESDGTYSLTGMSADTGSATLRAVYGSSTIDRVYSISKSKQGSAGQSGVASFWRSTTTEEVVYTTIS